MRRAQVVLGACLMVVCVPVEGPAYAGEEAHRGGERESVIQSPAQRTSDPIPIPEVRPAAPAPVPMPPVRPSKPAPVPMPLVRPSEPWSTEMPEPEPGGRDVTPRLNGLLQRDLMRRYE